MNIAIIPARGGSKRIPRKNIKVFCGKPMIAWPLQAALASGVFDRIVVSTDDPEIAELAKSLGVDVPFLRPPELSSDFSGTREVVIHAIDELEKRYGLLDSVCCLYATAVFVEPEQFQQAFCTMTDEDADMVVTVAPYASPVQRSLVMDEDFRLKRLYPEFTNTRSQDLPQAYYDAGQFYFGKSSAWKDLSRGLLNGALPITLPLNRVQDIDTPEDWAMAELLFQSSIDWG